MGREVLGEWLRFFTSMWCRDLKRDEARRGNARHALSGRQRNFDLLQASQSSSTRKEEKAANIDMLHLLCTIYNLWLGINVCYLLPHNFVHYLLIHSNLPYKWPEIDRALWIDAGPVQGAWTTLVLDCCTTDITTKALKQHYLLSLLLLGGTHDCKDTIMLGPLAEERYATETFGPVRATISRSDASEIDSVDKLLRLLNLLGLGPLFSSHCCTVQSFNYGDLFLLAHWFQSRGFEVGHHLTINLWDSDIIFKWQQLIQWIRKYLRFETAGVIKVLIPPYEIELAYGFFVYRTRTAIQSYPWYLPSEGTYVRPWYCTTVISPLRSCEIPEVLRLLVYRSRTAIQLYRFFRELHVQAGWPSRSKGREIL